MTEKKHIYLDYNATAPARKEAVQAMQEVMQRPLNPSSVHASGRLAKQMITQARQKIATRIEAEGAQVIFTSGGTEANNLALQALPEVSTVLVSAVEHASVMNAAKERGAGVIPVDNNGVVRLDALKRILEHSEGRVLVSVMLANNETGVIQPVEDIVKLVLEYGGYVHCDAAQAVGKIPVDFNRLNSDMMTLSGHKFGAPQGVGALVIKKGLHINPMIRGGGQESGHRAGTENVAGIVAMGVAAEMAPREMASEMRNYLEKTIHAEIPEAVIFSENVGRLPNTTCVALPGISSETQLIALDIEGIAVSAGSACSSGKVGVSHVLLAMGVPEELAACAIRVSIGNNCKGDVDRFVEVWKQLWLRKKNQDVTQAA